MLEEHCLELVRRAVSASVANARGYHSVSDWDVAETLGHPRTTSVASLPAIVIPVHDVQGKVAYYQLRPDHPRFVKSAGMARAKPAKYPAPKGARPVIDVHPAVLDRVRTGHEELYIVEGVIKADSAVSGGLAAIGLTAGVWGWRSGQPLPDWAHVELSDRRVLVVFDTDIRTNPSVRQAAHGLEDMLREYGANPVILEIPSPGEGFGLDDFFASGGSESELYPLEDYRDARGAARSLLVEHTSAGRGRHAKEGWFTPAQLKVGLYLLDKMRSGARCNVPIDTIAKDVGLSSKTVQGAVQALKTIPVGTSGKPLLIRNKGKDWASRPAGHRLVNGYALNLNAVAANMLGAPDDIERQRTLDREQLSRRAL